jgi:carboxyl-terminal processing protease
MPRLNLYIILAALLLYALTSGVTLRDRLLVSTLHRIERNAHVEPSSKELFEGAMSGMMGTLSGTHDDWYSMYIPPVKEVGYQDMLHNRYEGLGFTTRTHENGDEKQQFIDFPFYNSPAYRAGLRSGDQIVQVDGMSITDKTNSEFLELLRQSKEPETHLLVLPFGKTEPQEFSICREKIHRDSILGDYFEADKRVFHLEAHPKIGYIRITSFGNSTAEEFGNALDGIMKGGGESFILDLRGNPGGDVWNCVQIARMLISPNSENNILASMRPRNGRARSFVLTQGTQRCTLPMVVLVDGDTASSSEIVAAALQDYRRATVVGTRSFGKGVIQGIITLPFQSGMLQLTDAEYRRPSGAAIHQKKHAADTDDWGVIPDNIVELSEAEQRAVMQYRQWRSNIIAVDRAAVLEQFRQQFMSQLENKKSETEQQPFAFTGNAPYYDLQLDEAINILLKGTTKGP